jgi:hypothetical protein
MTDLQIANSLVDLYAGTLTSFDFVEPGKGDSGICWSSKRSDGVDYIFLRGSVTLADWFKDLIALAAPWTHDTLGPVHPGFLLGMDRCWAEIKFKTAGPWVVSGHSLGAGRAAILTGLMLEDGISPLARVTFGEPKPGFAQLAKFISKVPTRSYRNGHNRDHDLVTSVPISFPPEEYAHAETLIDVSAIPSLEETILHGPLRYHSMKLYVQALAGLVADAI